jgi:hypothetical protein
LFDRATQNLSCVCENFCTLKDFGIGCTTENFLVRPTWFSLRGASSFSFTVASGIVIKVARQLGCQKHA